MGLVACPWNGACVEMHMVLRGEAAQGVLLLVLLRFVMNEIEKRFADSRYSVADDDGDDEDGVCFRRFGCGC